MIHVDALDFSEWHSEEVISFFWRSVYFIVSKCCDHNTFAAWNCLELISMTMKSCDVTLCYSLFVFMFPQASFTSFCVFINGMQTCICVCDCMPGVHQTVIMSNYCYSSVGMVTAWSMAGVPPGKKIKIYFQGLLFTSHWLNLQHWTGFYIAVYGDFQGLFFAFRGRNRPEPPCIFPPVYHPSVDISVFSFKS